MIDLEQFCVALDAASPAGADLEYDPAFLSLEVAQKGKAERQFGDTVIPAEPPDWKLVLEQAAALGARTRDLRIACAFTRALTHLQGLEGLVRGLEMTDRLCRQMWEHVFPLLEDGEDPTFRMNALAPLADRDALLADIRASTFAAARGMGACTVRQVETALGILAPSHGGGEPVPSLPDIDAIVASAKAEGHFRENHAQRALDLVDGLQTYLTDRVGSTCAPNLQALVARLRPLAEYAKKFVASKQSEPTLPDPAQGPAVAPSAIALPVVSLPATGEIRSSQDAARMLDLVCAYFEKHEPTNPAPLLLRRAQRLSTMNFFDIVRDIAPDAVSSVEMVAGSRADS